MFASSCATEEWTDEHNIHSEYKIGNLAAGLITMSMQIQIETRSASENYLSAVTESILIQFRRRRYSSTNDNDNKHQCTK